MKLARVVLPWNASECAVDQLLNEVELDFLQLDFVWPQVWSCDFHVEDNRLSKWAVGLLAQLKIVHKALFLRPELCVLANAGGGDTIRAMEALAEFLLEHGSAEMPIAAVRGENLLSTLEWLPKELDLKDRQLLAAHAQIGGESLATALAEGARIVLAGAYDRAAPFVAAAVSRGFCGWHDYEMLGNIAAASQFENVLVDIEANGDIDLAIGAEPQLARVRGLPNHEHADVTCDFSDMKLVSSGRQSLRISQVRSQATNSTWNVRETYAAGFRGTALIEVPSQRVAEIQEFHANNDSNINAVKHTVEIFESEGSPAHKLVRFQWTSSSARKCQHFVELVQSWLRQKNFGEFSEPLSSLVHLTQTVERHIPFERLTLTVDTRPASEWL